MRVRWIGLTLALVLVGAAAGYGLGVLRQDEPTTFAAAEPVPAQSPSIPVLPVRVVPDPATPPPLQPGQRLVPRTVGTAPFDLVVPVPKGWVRTNPTSGEWRWYPQPGPDQTLNTYFLRVRLIGNSYQTITAALQNRIASLENADEVGDFHLEKQTGASFVASYVNGLHRRVAMEAFTNPNGLDTAYAWIALIGRESDRPGLRDLFPRVVDGATT
jgi:hypothetical protein